MFATERNPRTGLSAPSNCNTARILLADNQELVRDALRPTLQDIADDVLIYECNSFDEAICLAENEAPLSIALLSLHMPGMDGLKGAAAFHDRIPDLPFALLSGHDDVAEIVRAFDHGAIGFIPKTHNASSIASAVGLMLAGQRFIPGEIMDAIQHRSTATRLPLGLGLEENPDLLNRLTDREREVLKLLIEGKSNKVIAIALGLQEVTIKLHIRKLLRKLRVANRTQAAAIAIQSGWQSEL